MPGISIHVVDVARGVVAAGMRVEVFAEDPGTTTLLQIASGSISRTGTLDDPALAAMHQAASYEAVFHVGAYYAMASVAQSEPPFLDRVTYRFTVADPAQHYHLPFKCTPWGYSCFRGGA